VCDLGRDTRRVAARHPDEKAGMKSYVSVLAAATMAVLPVQPARAVPIGCRWDPSGVECRLVFTGTAHITCFGCGVSSGVADLTVTTPLGSGPVHATFTVVQSANTCPLNGTANGSFTGYLDGTFTWTRMGATAVITTSGDITGTGTAAFAPTDLGNPCGNTWVGVTVAGAITGN
jgi:hypothetical protein